jgi:hypothetical protein
MSFGINGQTEITPDDDSNCTYDYVKNIEYGNIPRDFANIDNATFNSVFGNAMYELHDVTDEFTLTKLTEVITREQAITSRWEAFKWILKNVVGPDIMVICDANGWCYDAYRDSSGTPIANYPYYDHSKIWNLTYPDIDTMTIVKYYPLSI